MAFASLASPSVDIELVATCPPPPLLHPLTIRTTPRPGIAGMSGVRGIGGDAIVVGELVPVVIEVIVRSDTVSTSSAVTIAFDSGCPGLRPPSEGSAFQGKRGDRDASAIGDTDLRFNGTLRLVVAPDPSDS